MTQSCYRKSWNGTDDKSYTINSSQTDVPCGNYNSDDGNYPCCNKGHQCLDDLLCYSPSSEDGASGFYTAACTDESYDSTACNQHCADIPFPDVVYETNESLWACCGVTDTDCVLFGCSPSCQSPTNQTFWAPAAESLLAATSATTSFTVSETHSATSTSHTTTETQATHTATSTPSNTSSSDGTTHTKQGLSAGAKAAIGVCVSVTGILLLVGLIWAFRRHQLRRGRERLAGGVEHPLRELPANTRSGQPVELPGEHLYKHELQS